MLVLLDSNVLLRFVEPQHPHHASCAAAIDGLRQKGHELVLVPQTIYEFWSVATRPVPDNGLGMSTQEAETELTRAKRLFPLLRDERVIFDRWEELVRQYRVKGKKAHDTRLVAAMQRHRISHLLTFNIADFARYAGIVVLDPAAVAAGTAAL